jgi:hypothetical protein
MPTTFTIMQWYNAQRDTLPEDGQTVLISVNGVYYIALFDKVGNSFALKDRPELRFNADEYLIYWTDFVDPE